MKKTSSIFNINDKFFIIFVLFVFILLLGLQIFLSVDNDVENKYYSFKPNDNLKILHYEINTSWKMFGMFIFCILLGFITSIMGYLGNNIFHYLTYTSSYITPINIILLIIYVINVYLLLFFNTHVIMASRFIFLLGQIFGGISFMILLHMFNIIKV